MDIVIIANAWSAADRNPTGKHQLALQFIAKGHRVLWIEGSGMRRPRIENGDDRSRMRAKIQSAMSGFRRTPEGLHTVAPLILPIPEQPVVRALNAMIYLVTALAGSLWLGFRKPVLLNYLPIVSLTEALWPWKTVYYCVDRWDRFSAYNGALMRRADRACCRHAERVLATSNDLYRRCCAVSSDVRLIGHGVNVEHFQAPLMRRSHPVNRPGGLPAGRIAGFFGLLSEWIDQDLVLALAGALQTLDDASAVLIGPHDVDIRRLRGVPKLLLPGPLPFRELPAWAACFDVGIIPFKVNPLTHAVNPVKLREMIAAGCPVVSTALREVALAAETIPAITVADGPDRFIAAVCRQLSCPPLQADRLALSNMMRTESWSAKADAVLDALSDP